MDPSEETKALVKVAERLSGRFPEATVEKVREIVSLVVGDFEGARVRDFVPVLVEREAAERLRSTIPTQSRSTSST
jgi:hypothetical protein